MMKKLMHTLLLTAALLSALCVSALAAEDYHISITLETRSIYAALSAPAAADPEALYTVWFYREENGIHNSLVRYHDKKAGELFAVNTTDTVDRVRVYSTLGGVDDPDQPYLADFALSKAISRADNVLEFPEGDVFALAMENPDYTNEQNEYIYLFDGLDLDAYEYTLKDSVSSKTFQLTEADFYTEGLPAFYGRDYWIGNGIELRAYMTGETEDAYVKGYTQPRLLDIPVVELEDAVVVTVNGGGTVTMGNRRYAVNGIAVSAPPVEKTVTTDGVAKIPYASGEAGYYDITITRPGCLTHTFKNVEVSDKFVDLGTVDLISGDVNGDGKINISDMGAFRQDFGKVGGAIADPLTDMNGDEKVNIADMGIFRQNFGKTAEKDATVFLMDLGEGGGQSQDVPDFESHHVFYVENGRIVGEDLLGPMIEIYAGVEQVDLIVDEAPVEPGFYTCTVNKKGVYSLHPIQSSLIADVEGVWRGKYLTLAGDEDTDYVLTDDAVILDLSGNAIEDLADLSGCMDEDAVTARAIFHHKKDTVLFLLIEST